MNRRKLLCIALLVVFATPVLAAPRKYQTFVLRIKTKDGNVINNVSITAFDAEDAKTKVQSRYLGCQILGLTKR